MKNFTLLFFFISGLLVAQQAQSYTDISLEAQENETVKKTTITSSFNNNNQPIIDTYTTFLDFQDALIINCSDTLLTLENFEGGPSIISVCGSIISDAGDGCFSAGELESGFNVQASNNTDIVFIPVGAIGNTNPLVGSELFIEYTIINFSPNVYAVAMDLWENNVPETTVRIFDSGGVLIESLFLNTPTGTQTFFGIIADEPISSIEIEGVSGSGELFGNFFFGANCDPLSVNEYALSQITLTPNPSADIITINNPSNIEIDSTILYDLLGKIALKNTNKNQLDISNLPTGVYLLKIISSEVSITKKVIKK